MRDATRIQGRFISTCGLKKTTDMPESRYQLVIVDQTGCPVSHLVAWHRLRQKQPGTDGTLEICVWRLLIKRVVLIFRSWSRNGRYKVSLRMLRVV